MFSGGGGGGGGGLLGGGRVELLSDSYIVLRSKKEVAKGYTPLVKW